MTKLVPVSLGAHVGKGWRSSGHFASAAAQAVVPLVGAEFAKAALAMPIAFIEQAGRFVAVAVLSPVAGRNFFVGAAGRWLGAYIPAAVRSYPFHLGRIGDAEEVSLCIDEDSGLIVDAAAGDGEKFFEADGSASSAAKAMLEFLVQVERSRTATDLAVAALAEAGLIVPWPLQMQAAGHATPVNGLFRIDEAGLNGLGDPAFLALRKTAALPLAYLQLLSMAQLAVFDGLSQTQQQLDQAHQRQQRISSLDELFENAQGGTLRFN